MGILQFQTMAVMGIFCFLIKTQHRELYWSNLKGDSRVRHINISDKIMPSMFHCLYHGSYCCIKSSSIVFPFGLLTQCPEWGACSVQLKPSLLFLLPGPLRHPQSNGIPEVPQGVQHFPICEKDVVVFEVWDKEGLAEDHNHCCFPPTPIPCPSRGHEEIQGDVQSSPSVWQPWVTRILSWQGHKLL